MKVMTGCLLVLLGLIVGFVGVVLISADSFAIGGDQAFGVVLILGALVCYAFSANLAVPLQQRYGGPTLMLHVEATGALLTAPLAAWGLRTSHFEWRPFLAVLTLGVVGTGAAFAVMASAAWAGSGGPACSWAAWLR